MLKSLLAAAAGVGAGRLADFFSFPAALSESRDCPSMPERMLGGTGRKVKLFGLGGESAVEQRSRREKAIEIIDSALDMGVNYIDTSHHYGRGGSESNVGEVMARRRNDVFLATKTFNSDYDGAMRDCETSLRRLQTDVIDLYQHHAVDSDERLNRIMGGNGALKAFEKLRDEGIVRHLGISSHSPRILLDAMRRYEYDCVLVPLNPAGMHMLDAGYLRGFFAMARKKNVGIIAMKVAGKGKIFERGITMKQALAYTLSFPVSTAIVGITDRRQVIENVDFVRKFKRLRAEELRLIEQAVSV